MRQTARILSCIAVLAGLPTIALAQGGPDTRKCPGIESSRVAFTNANDEASTIAATIAHITLTEGARKVGPKRQQEIADMVRGIGWREHKQQALRDVAADRKMNRCS